VKIGEEEKVKKEKERRIGRRKIKINPKIFKKKEKEEQDEIEEPKPRFFKAKKE